MAPFADMANHEIPPNTKWGYNEKTNMFIVEAEKYLQRGDILYETYGEKSNYRYFVNYGFTVNNNKSEEAALAMNMQSFMVYKLLAKSILEHEDKTRSIRDLFEKELIKGIDSKLMELIITEYGTYVVGYTYNDVAKKLFREMRGGSEQPTTREQEIAIHEQIIRVIDLTLNGFVTTVEQDEALLREYDYNFNLRNTIVIRKEEKKVLNFWRSFCTSCIASLRSNENAPFKRLIKKMAKTEKSGSFIVYLRELETAFKT
jgi:histone-lysine N-methyltransferase SETD3